MEASKKDVCYVKEIEEAISALSEIHLDGLSESGLIDTSSAVSALVDTLYAQPTTPPSLYIDIEGVDLSRDGSISIIQVYVLPKSRAYLIDVHTLKEEVFSAPGTNGHTFKDLLESSAIPKVFFDVRNDSDALFSLFDIRLNGIQDLQLMQLATRLYSRKFVCGLGKCIEKDAPMKRSERTAWMAVKEKGLKLFAPAYGGSYEVFNERPLSEEMRLYCTQDVQFLPTLWKYYDVRLTKRWRSRVIQASKDRVALSQSSGYIGHGSHMTLAPEGWAVL